MSKHIKTELKEDQRGIVSITVTFLIIVVISLVVLGFARLVRREQRQSFDRQLSTQAFYAAETGINDAIEALRTGAQVGVKDTCTPAPWESPSLDTNGQVSYTCVLISPSSSSLVYDSVDSAKSTVFPIRTTLNGAAVSVGTIKIEWQAANSGTDYSCPSSGQFPDVWTCDLGLLRIDLVPFGDGDGSSRNELIDETFTAFLYPQTGGGSIAYTESVGLAGSNSAGKIVNGSCSGGTCSVEISGLTDNTYYARVRSIYAPARMTVSSTTAGVQFVGAQAVIDSTGKVGDVLRRIQVRAPLSPEGLWPDFAVQTKDGFCKRFSIAPPDYVSPDLGSATGVNCDPRTSTF